MIALTLGCAGVVVRVPAVAPSRDQLAELWIDRGTTPGDLYWGIGGKKYAPPADADGLALRSESSGAFNVGRVLFFGPGTQNRDDRDDRTGTSA